MDLYSCELLNKFDKIEASKPTAIYEFDIGRFSGLKEVLVALISLQ